MNRFAGLLYHGLSESPKKKDYLSFDDFGRQLAWLRSHGFAICSFRDLWQQIQSGASPSRYLVMSFDDGHKSNLQAAEMLSEVGGTATFFLVKKACEWEEGPYLRPAQVCELTKNHDIGSHSVSHPRLSRLTSSQLRGELADSKAWLEDLCGQPVTAFSAPHGDYDQRTVRTALELGYSLFATSVTWWNHPETVARSRIVARVSVERSAAVSWLGRVVECRARPFLIRWTRSLLAAPLKRVLPSKAVGRLRNLR